MNIGEGTAAETPPSCIYDLSFDTMLKQNSPPRSYRLMGVAFSLSLSLSLSLSVLH
jgi:hypothetical protein